MQLKWSKPNWESPQEELTHTLSHEASIIRETPPKHTHILRKTKTLRELSLFLLIIKPCSKQEQVTYYKQSIHTHSHKHTLFSRRILSFLNTENFNRIVVLTIEKVTQQQRKKVTQDWIYWNFKSNLSKRKQGGNLLREVKKKYKHKLHLAFFYF